MPLRLQPLTSPSRHTMALRKKAVAPTTQPRSASTGSAAGKASPTTPASSSPPRDPLPFRHFLPRLPLQLVAVLFSCIASSSVTVPDKSIPAPTRFLASLIQDPLSTLPLLCGLLAIVQGWFGYWARSCRLEAEKAKEDGGTAAKSQVETRTERKSFRGSLGKLWDNALKGEAPHQRLFKQRADGQPAFASIDTRVSHSATPSPLELSSPSLPAQFVPQAVMVTLGATLALHCAIVLLGAPLTRCVNSAYLAIFPVLTHSPHTATSLRHSCFPFSSPSWRCCLSPSPFPQWQPRTAASPGCASSLRFRKYANLAANEPSADEYTNSPTDNLELVLFAPAIGTIVGAWTGAFPIPLDWDRPWQVRPECPLFHLRRADALRTPQKWPVTPIVGALAGHALGSIIGFAVVAWRKTLEAAVDVLQEIQQNEGVQRKTGGMREARKIK